MQGEVVDCWCCLPSRDGQTVTCPLCYLQCYGLLQATEAEPLSASDEDCVIVVPPEVKSPPIPTRVLAPPPSMTRIEEPAAIPVILTAHCPPGLPTQGVTDSTRKPTRKPTISKRM